MQTSKDLYQRKLGEGLVERQEMIEQMQKVDHLLQFDMQTEKPLRSLTIHPMSFAMICAIQRILKTRSIEQCKT